MTPPASRWSNWHVPIWPICSPPSGLLLNCSPLGFSGPAASLFLAALYRSSSNEFLVNHLRMAQWRKRGTIHGFLDKRCWGSTIFHSTPVINRNFNYLLPAWHYLLVHWCLLTFGSPPSFFLMIFLGRPLPSTDPGTGAPWFFRAHQGGVCQSSSHTKME